MKHQLRIQAAQVLQTPIVGDHQYGVRTSSDPWAAYAEPGKLFLHSAQVTLDRHLKSGKRFRLGISAGVPPYFAQLCDVCGLPLTDEDRFGGVFVNGKQIPVKPGKTVKGTEGSWLPEWRLPES